MSVKNTLKITRLVFEAEVLWDVTLPGFIGNTIRGALGRPMANMFCKKSEPDCCDCPARSDCVYGSLFKSAARSAEFPSCPNPFVIDAPERAGRCYTKGEIFRFEMMLFGTGIRWFGQVAASANAMFAENFAGYQNAFRLIRILDGKSGRVLFENGAVSGEPVPAIWSDQHAGLIDPVTSLRITFITPAQILRNGELVETPDFAVFIDSLFARIGAMIDIYGENEFVLPYGLTHRKPLIQAEFDLRKVMIEQKDRHIEGILGGILYSGSLTRYVPYIDLGSQIHIGKKTTHGCGKYTLELLN